MLIQPKTDIKLITILLCGILMFFKYIIVSKEKTNCFRSRLFIIMYSVCTQHITEKEDQNTNTSTLIFLSPSPIPIFPSHHHNSTTSLPIHLKKSRLWRRTSKTRTRTVIHRGHRNYSINKTRVASKLNSFLHWVTSKSGCHLFHMNEDNVTTIDGRDGTAPGPSIISKPMVFEDMIIVLMMMMKEKKRDRSNKPMRECDHGFDLGGLRFVLLVSMPSLYKSRWGRIELAGYLLLIISLPYI